MILDIFNCKKTKDFDNQRIELYKIGKIFDIERNEIKAIMRKKKVMFVIGILILLISIFSGCLGPGRPGYHYGAVCIQDFSWIWRIF